MKVVLRQGVSTALCSGCHRSEMGTIDFSNKKNVEQAIRGFDSRG